VYTGSKACFQKLLGQIKFHYDYYKLWDLHTMSYLHCECTSVWASILGGCAHAYSYPAPPWEKVQHAMGGGQGRRTLSMFCSIRLKLLRWPTTSGVFPCVGTPMLGLLFKQNNRIALEGRTLRSSPRTRFHPWKLCKRVDLQDPGQAPPGKSGATRPMPWYQDRAGCTSLRSRRRLRRVRPTPPCHRLPALLAEFWQLCSNRCWFWQWNPAQLLCLWVLLINPDLEVWYFIAKSPLPSALLLVHSHGSYVKQWRNSHFRDKVTKDLQDKVIMNVSVSVSSPSFGPTCLRLKWQQELHERCTCNLQHTSLDVGCKHSTSRACVAQWRYL